MIDSWLGGLWTICHMCAECANTTMWQYKICASIWTVSLSVSHSTTLLEERLRTEHRVKQSGESMCMPVHQLHPTLLASVFAARRLWLLVSFFWFRLLYKILYPTVSRCIWDFPNYTSVACMHSCCCVFAGSTLMCTKPIQWLHVYQYLTSCYFPVGKMPVVNENVECIQHFEHALDACRGSVLWLPRTIYRYSREVV